jgi:hypothetical protein
MEPFLWLVAMYKKYKAFSNEENRLERLIIATLTLSS